LPGTALVLRLAAHCRFADRDLNIRNRDLKLAQQSIASVPRIGPALVAVALLAAAAAYVVPRAGDALDALDDPSRVADHAMGDKFDATVVQREIEGALAANDADLAQSFADLAADRHVALDPSLVEKVKAATAEAATTRHKAQSFARGFITGEPDDMAALAGTTLGDLFVFGDIRDALREGTRLAMGQKADELVLGLASAGIAITAASYVTLARLRLRAPD